MDIKSKIAYVSQYRSFSEMELFPTLDILIRKRELHRQELERGKHKYENSYNNDGNVQTKDNR